MRLLFVGPDMSTGGAQRQWVTLIPALAERGHTPALLTLTGEGRLFAEVAGAGVPAFCAGLARRTDAGGLARALRFGRGRADVVVSRAVSAELLGHLLARREGARHVVNEHTPCTLHGELLALRPHQRRLRRLYAPRVDGVVAVARAQLAPLARAGFRPERMAVVANGVVLGERPSAPPRGEKLALMAAGLRPEKRVDVFVEAVSRVPGLRGVVAGEGRERGRLEQLIARTGAPVELLGAREDVGELMKRAQVVCLPSEAEALPMSVLEAMAAARAVAATPVGGVAEAVSHGHSGLLVAPGDPGALAAALGRILEGDTAARMGAAGRARCEERFSQEAMVEGYERALAG
jgi:glycosyltransferase involved in cell wall biosynthesis